MRKVGPDLEITMKQVLPIPFCTALFCTALFCTAIFCAAILAHPALAQDNIVTAIPMGDVNDHFDKTAKSAGGRLVGLSLDLGNSAKFNPGNVWVTMPPKATDVICVSGVSRDGLYWSRTPYQIASAQGSESQVKLLPFTNKYETQLLAYDSDDIAVFAFAARSPNCFAEVPTVLPIITKANRSAPAEISAQVNSGNFKISVLVDVGDGPKEMACRQDNDRIAFDVDCTFPVTLGDTPIDGSLTLITDDGLSAEPEEFTLRLPARQ